MQKQTTAHLFSGSHRGNMMLSQWWCICTRQKSNVWMWTKLTECLSKIYFFKCWCYALICSDVHKECYSNNQNIVVWAAGGQTVEKDPISPQNGQLWISYPGQQHVDHDSYQSKLIFVGWICFSCLGLYTPGRFSHGNQVLGERPDKV